MKKLFTALVLFISSLLLLSSCSTTYAERTKYFGYNNNSENFQESNDEVVYLEEENSQKWENPLSKKNNYENKNDVEVVYIINNSPIYVPVVVPWWRTYYGWIAYYDPVFSFHWRCGYYWGWDWYSPWYHYHPYYGYVWGPYYYDYYWSYPGYYHWYYQPYYSYYRHYKDPNSRDTRRFGPGRGDHDYRTYNRSSYRNGIINSSSRDDSYVTGTSGRSYSRLYSGRSTIRTNNIDLSNDVRSTVRSSISPNNYSSSNNRTNVRSINGNNYLPSTNTLNRSSDRSNSSITTKKYDPDKFGSSSNNNLQNSNKDGFYNYRSNSRSTYERKSYDNSNNNRNSSSGFRSSSPKNSNTNYNNSNSKSSSNGSSSSSSSDNSSRSSSRGRGR